MDNKYPMDGVLKRINNAVELLKNTPGRKDKMVIIEEHLNILGPLIQVILDPFKKFHITLDTIEKHIVTGKHRHKYKIPHTIGELYKMLDALASREVSGTLMKDWVMDTLATSYDCRPLLTDIFCKNLGIRVGSKEMNKAYPGFIPCFEVVLAKPLTDEYLADLEDDIRSEDFKREWVIQRKLDGVRCVVICSNPSGAHLEIKAYTRKGLEIETIDKVKEDLRAMIGDDTKGVIGFDGELCIIDENGNEDFKHIISEFRTGFTKYDPHYKIFDMLNEYEVKNWTDRLKEKDKLRYKDRFKILKKFIGDYKSTYFSRVMSYNYTDRNYRKLWDKAEKEGWEGLMLRKNTVYEAKRSRDLLKVKSFQTEEFKVVGMGIGPFPIMNKVTRKEVKIKTMLNINVEFKGGTVGVGSGFTVAERRHYFKNPNDIIGKMVSVRFEKETVDSKTGLPGLRFPTYKGCYGESRDM